MLAERRPLPAVDEPEPTEKNMVRIFSLAVLPEAERLIQRNQKAKPPGENRRRAAELSAVLLRAVELSAAELGAVNLTAAVPGAAARLTNQGNRPPKKDF